MSEIKPNEPLMVHELFNFILFKKKISATEIAKITGLSDKTVSQFRGDSSNGNPYANKNPHIETIEKYFEASGEKFEVINSKGKKYIPANDIATIGKLYNTIGDFSLRTSFGDFKITTRK
jgi:transcriptional regulator with XRE-family HTH domain